MNAPETVDQLFELYEARGSEFYGESLTQVEHALQSAALASGERASDQMILAALFHDVGHLVTEVQNEEEFDFAHDDDVHEALGARILSPLFGPAVARPVSLHVTAKRWRCTREPAYIEQLSDASRATLQAQGGLLSDDECLRFEEHPGFVDALTLRTWDDEAKVVGKDAGALRDYVTMANSLAASWSRARRAH
ncbi:MAG TPA: HD domain-containing protein [Acidimicrobiales bacterium]|nr:HD domain-containing protein [Acidimicrobiales bacterium]